VRDVTPLCVNANTALDQSIVFDSARVIDAYGDDLWLCQVMPSTGPTDGIIVTPYNGSFPSSAEPLAPYITFSGQAATAGTALWDVSVCDPQGGQLVFRTGLDVASVATAPVASWFDHPAIKIVPSVFSLIIFPLALKFHWARKWLSRPLANAVRKKLNLHFEGRLGDDPEKGEAAEFVDFIELIKTHLTEYDDYRKSLGEVEDRIKKTNPCSLFFSPLKCSESKDERRINVLAGHIVDAITEASEQRGAIFGIIPKGRCDSIQRGYFCSSMNKIKNRSALLLVAPLIAQNAYEKDTKADGDIEGLEMVHNQSFGGGQLVEDIEAVNNPANASELFVSQRPEGQPPFDPTNTLDDDDQDNLPALPPLPA
jgi:hypothetical protein